MQLPDASITVIADQEALSANRAEQLNLSLTICSITSTDHYASHMLEMAH
jgi:hypothetical protein